MFEECVHVSRKGGRKAGMQEDRREEREDWTGRLGRMCVCVCVCRVCLPRSLLGTTVSPREDPSRRAKQRDFGPPPPWTALRWTALPVWAGCVCGLGVLGLGVRCPSMFIVPHFFSLHVFFSQSLSLTHVFDSPPIFTHGFSRPDCNGYWKNEISVDRNHHPIVTNALSPPHFCLWRRPLLPQCFSLCFSLSFPSLVSLRVPSQVVSVFPCSVSACRLCAACCVLYIETHR